MCIWTDLMHFDRLKIVSGFTGTWGRWTNLVWGPPLSFFRLLLFSPSITSLSFSLILPLYLREAELCGYICNLPYCRVWEDKSACNSGLSRAGAKSSLQILHEFFCWKTSDLWHPRYVDVSSLAEDSVFSSEVTLRNIYRFFWLFNPPPSLFTILRWFLYCKAGLAPRRL